MPNGAEIFDIAVIGGGVNGCGIARDAVGRGLKVLLAEQNDLASGTSSASTKLIHGGLRYLEHYEFRLVREALIEREVLLRAAPHIIWPLRFILPHHKGLRPRWFVRLGLFLYDNLGGRKILPGTRSIDLRHDAAGAPLKPGFTHAFEYSDCWVEDARLVVLNARDAAERGAEIHVRTRCTSARREGDLWHLTLEGPDGVVTEAKARALVNAAGPWVSSFLGGAVGMNAPDKIRTVKGSHIVVEKLFDHDRAYIFQNADGRICFAIPYEQDFTLIGTTDADYQGEPGKVAISDTETDYLLSAASEYFQAPVTRANIRWTYAGIRPLYDDGASKAQDATRDYVLKLDQKSGEAPLLSVFGGKITTYRRLAEAALEKLQPTFPGMKAPWTATGTLPGGDFPVNEFATQVGTLAKKYPFLELREARRLVRAYGTRAHHIMGNARASDDLGRRFGPSLTEAEVRYLMDQEWATSAEDIIWRRSKLGLHMTTAEQSALEEFVASLLVRHQQPALAGHV
ncbi:glycerol-3-phosphate dehydrogenase [Dongia mobilis]|uniref:glycerol-3-phosphate dehydrogenase n=1 Tax=Dongia sp. TaxID=1977262 RepID=UPI0026EB02D6